MTNESTFSSTLGEYFITALQELYWSESNLETVLATMADVATSQELRNAFKLHREQTRTHAERIEKIFSELGVEARQQHCLGLQGLFDEGWKVIDQTESGSAQRDVALIIAAQKVEHYEMAIYGSLRTLAKTLGQKDIAKILKETLEEEKETDALLTELAEADINEEASEEPVAATTSMQRESSRM